MTLKEGFKVNRRWVKHLVVPFIYEISEEDVAEALELMAEQKLIKLYEDDTGRSLIQVLDWWEWQTGLRYKAESHYQPPEGWTDRVTLREGGKFAKEEDNNDNR